MASPTAPALISPTHQLATPSYVFKLKYTSPLTPQSTDTRRYGFRGDLRQRDVFSGLAHRAAQVFGLESNEFYLTTAKRTQSGGEGEEDVELDTYDRFLTHVCRPILIAPATTVKKDEKGRIVIVFQVRRADQRVEDLEKDMREALVRSQATAAQEGRARQARAIEKVKQLHEANARQAATVSTDAKKRAMAVHQEAHERAVSATHRPLFDQQLSTDNAYGWNFGTPPPPPHLALSSLLASKGSNATLRPPVPVTSPIPTPVVAPVAAEPVVAVEAQKETFGSVKEMLTKFVGDLNRHLADNFGDEAAGFALNLPTFETKVEETVAVPVVVRSPVSTCFCDRCLRTITGTRNTCLDCPNYDLCETCYSSRPTFHPSHTFQVVGATPQVVNTERITECSTKTVEHNATCDLCNKGPISGTRWKCLNCPDYDVCTPCHALLPALHPHHNFLPVNTQTQLPLQPSDRVVHAFVKCDECGTTPITGVRYHCLEKECEDYDMCAACEADPVERHDRKHVLAKVRVPTLTLATRLQEMRASVGGAAVERKVEAEKHVEVEKVEETVVEEVEEVVIDFETRLRMFLGAGRADEPEEALVDEDAMVKDVVSVGQDSTAPSEEEPRTLHSTFGATPITFSNPIDEPYSYDQLVAAAETEDLPQVQLKDLDAIFISDVTLVDGSVVPAGGEFNKIWRVLNNGLQTWPLGTRLVHVSGFSSRPLARALRSHDAPTAAAGEIVELVCELKAPEEGGRHMDHWRLTAPDGTRFGHRFWVDITVEEEGRDGADGEGGSNLSSSIVTPSLTLAGRTAPTTEDGTVRSIEDDVVSRNGTEESVEEEEEDFVVLSDGISSGTTSDGSSDSESESDEEWRV